MQSDLIQLNRDIEACQACTLYSLDKPTFGYGNIDARILLVGQSPGADEAEQQRPFVGESGQKLREAFGNVGFDMDTGAYTFNTLLHRPPGNRKGTAKENRACAPFLDRVISIMPNLEIIVPIGGDALKRITGATGIEKLAGYSQDVEIANKKLKCFPILHPAYILRNPHKEVDLVRQVAGLVKLIRNQVVKIDTDYRLIDNETDALRLADILLESNIDEWLGVDIETIGNKPDAPILGIGISWVDYSGFFVAFRECGGSDRLLFDPDPFIKKILPILMGETKWKVVGQNLKFEDIQFRRYGIRLNYSGDSMLASRLVVDSQQKFDLETLIARFFPDEFGHKKIIDQYLTQDQADEGLYHLIPLNILAPYCCQDADASRRIHNKALQMLEANV